MPQQRKKTIKADGLLTRNFAVEANGIDVEARTVTLSVSSETKVERWFGWEILDHKPSSIRVDRIKNAAPVIDDHWGDQIGVIDDFSIKNKRCFAVLRFGNSQRAIEVFQDILDGIRRNVSIGYTVHRMQLEESSPDGNSDNDVYRAIDWEPYEISIVRIPADTSVGVGRAAEFAHEITIVKGSNMDDDQGIQKPAAQPTADNSKLINIDRSQIERDVRSKELQRINDLNALGVKFRQYGGEEMAKQYVSDGRSVEEFRNALLEKIPTVEKAGSGGKPAGALDLSEKDKSTYSLFRAITAANSGDWSKAGFELECAVAVSEKLGRQARGFYVPYDVLGRSQRTMTTAQDSGGRLVATDYMPDEFIERLRTQTIVSTLGARYLTGLVGNPEIPGGESGATFYWLDESENVSDSDLGFRSVGMSPKTVAGAVPLTRRLLMQSSPSMEALIEDDLRKGMALAIDKAAITGAGGKSPTGVLNQAGALTQTLAAAGNPTRTEMIKFKTKMKKANSYIGNPVFLVDPELEEHFESTPIDAGSGRFLLENGRVVGHNMVSTNIMPADTVLFGNFSDMLIGMWGVLDLMPDKAKLAASGGLVLRIFQDVDIAIRHPQSFVKSVAA